MGTCACRRRLLTAGWHRWEERRGKELLNTRLEGSVSLAELAASCQASIRHFTRAFRASTGQSPRRWLIQRRLDKASELFQASATSRALRVRGPEPPHAALLPKDGTAPRRSASAEAQLRAT